MFYHRFRELRSDIRELWGAIIGVFLLLSRIATRSDLLLITFTVLFASIVLTNNIIYARTIYLATVLPASMLVGVAVMHRVLRGSIIFWAVAAYLLTLGFSSFYIEDIPANEISRHFRQTAWILSFLTVVSVLASDAKGLKLMLLACCSLLAVSAAINMVGYAVGWELPPPFFQRSPLFSDGDRLIAALGMPGYSNSTNLSAPYVIFGVAALGMLTRSDVGKFERRLFALSAMILLLGLVWTQARSGYAGAIVGTMILALASNNRWRFFYLGTGAVILVAFTAVSVFGSRGGSYRLELWSSYFDLAGRRPFSGFGILADITRTMRDGFVVDQPHNIVLSAFVRGGTVGASAMVLIIASAIIAAMRYWQWSGQIVPLAVIVTMTVCGMFDYQILATYPTWPWITFWLPIAIGIGVEISNTIPQTASFSTSTEQQP